MKNMVSIFFFLSVSMCLIGCGDKSGVGTEKNYPQTEMTTMYKLLEGEESITCTFHKNSADGATFSGIVYIKDAHTMRHQAVGTYKSQTIETNLLLLDNQIYSRIGGDQKKGYTLATNSGGVETSRHTLQKELDEVLPFVCTPGVKNDLFAVPTDIIFEQYQ